MTSWHNGDSMKKQNQNASEVAVPKAVFITGANGFIGKALAERYRALGCEVKGMDLNADPKLGVVAGSLSKTATWKDQVAGCDLFINTAAVVSMAAPWKEYCEISVEAVRSCIELAVANGCKRFVHFSSMAALGWDYKRELDETGPVVIGKDFRYGVAKGASEHVVLAAHAAGEIDCTIIRPGDVYGPGSRAWMVEPLKAAQSGMLVLPNKGEGRFSPVYIDDLVEGVMLAAGLPQGSGQIFNLSAGETVSCRSFFTHHWRWAGRKGSPPTLPLGAAVALTRIIALLTRLSGRRTEATPDTMLMFARQAGMSIDKARNLLGFKPKVTLEEGLRRSEVWLRETGQIR